MSAIKEHYHDEIYQDYNSMTPEQSAKTARAETLKEIIKFCDSKQYDVTGDGFMAYLDVQVKCQKLLNAIQ